MPTLSDTEVSDFYSLGYHPGTRVMSEGQAAKYRARFESFEHRYPNDVIKLDQKAHMLCPWIDEMMRVPGLLGRLEGLLGPDILCWGTSLRLKEADGKTFAGWHQDTAYAEVKPIVVICALALSPCTRESGCIRVMPKSHKWDLLPHRENVGTDSLLTREQTIDAALDDTQAVDLELAPGEVAFFNNAICHSSAPNHSDDRRILFLIEMVPTKAYQDFPRESATLVRGVDEYHHFDVDERPEAEMSVAALKAWREKVQVQAEVLFRGASRPPRALR